MYQNLLELNLLVDIMMIFKQVILVSIKRKNSFGGNTISQASKEMSKPISKAIMFFWLQMWLTTSFTMTFNCY